MRWLMVAMLACVWPIAAMAADKSIVKNVKSLREFKIVSEETSADGVSMKLVFDCPDGIFSFDVDLGAAKIEKLTFVVKNQAHWEGVEFSPTGKKQAADLKTTPGTTIAADGKDCVITLTGDALALFKAGGRFQFVNLYRG